MPKDIRETARRATATSPGAAGFVNLALEAKPECIETLRQWNDPLYRGIIENLPAGARLAEYVTSLSIAARNPGV